MELKCKKCRQLVADASAIITHETISGKNAHFIKSCSFSKRNNILMEMANNVPILCSSYLLDPVEWELFLKNRVFNNNNINTSQSPSSSFSLSDEGKINCWKCGSKLGLFQHHGIQCSCGFWGSGVQILKSKVDEIKKIIL